MRKPNSKLTLAATLTLILTLTQIHPYCKCAVIDHMLFFMCVFLKNIAPIPVSITTKYTLYMLCLPLTERIVWQEGAFDRGAFYPGGYWPGWQKWGHLTGGRLTVHWKQQAFAGVSPCWHYRRTWQNNSCRHTVGPMRIVCDVWVGGGGIWMTFHWRVQQNNSSQWPACSGW